MKTYWAVVDLGESLPQAPYLVTRYRWYARWVLFWMGGHEVGDDGLVIMPWEPGSTIRHD